jgi:hypothetical protein
MQVKWFKPWGWFYLPVAVPGVLILGLALAFCVHIFIAVDRRSHSVSDTLYGVFPYVAPCFLMVNWIAVRTGGVRVQPVGA